MSRTEPKYRHFKPRDIGFVCWKNKRHYFTGSPFNSIESKQAYYDFLAANCGTGQPAVAAPVEVIKLPTTPPAELTIAELAGMYLAAHETTIHGKRSEFNNYRRILLLLVERFGQLPVSEFGPRKLKSLQSWLAETDQVREYRNGARKLTNTRTYRLTRGTINHLIGNLKRVFKWGVSEEHVRAEQLTGLSTVRGLAFEKSGAREVDPKQPVSWKTVSKILPKLSPVIADMVRLQWYTGCRPRQVCTVRPCEIDTNKTPWGWTPGRHKNTHRGQSLVIFLGPLARRILKPYLARDPESFCFSPREAITARVVRRGHKVKSTMSKFGLHYNVDAYSKAILYGIASLVDPAIRPPFTHAKFEAASLTYWTPHQLRHSRGTEVREQFGLEAAQAVLGHASLAATQIYAKKRMELARDVAAKSG